MASSINASTTAGVVTTADTSGLLALQTAGTTAISIDASQAVTMAGRTSNPTTISVGGATPSTSGAGITFPTTQSASSDAKTLDDYEEGSHTTTANANTTLDTSYRAFKYTKVGNVVNVVGLLQITGSTGSTTLTFTLPFTAAADQTNGQNRSAGGCLPASATTGTGGMVPFVQNNTAVMNLYKITLGTATNSSYAAATNADVINGSSINFNITYLTT